MDYGKRFAHCGRSAEENAGLMQRLPHQVRRGQAGRVVRRSTFDTCPKCFAPPAAPCIFTAMGKVTYRTLAGAQKA